MRSSRNASTIPRADVYIPGERRAVRGDGGGKEKGGISFCERNSCASHASRDAARSMRFVTLLARVNRSIRRAAEYGYRSARGNISRRLREMSRAGDIRAPDRSNRFGTLAVHAYAAVKFGRARRTNARAIFSARREIPARPAREGKGLLRRPRKSQRVDPVRTAEIRCDLERRSSPAKATPPRAVHFSPRKPIPPAALLGLPSYSREPLLVKTKTQFFMSCLCIETLSRHFLADGFRCHNFETFGLPFLAEYNRIDLSIDFNFI